MFRFFAFLETQNQLFASAPARDETDTDFNILSAPNIVTTDEKRREVWIYDKISTTQAYSTSSGGVSALILGGTLVGNGLVGGIGNAAYSSADGATATTQKTLTVVIKYDEQGMVRDFAYHTSTF